MTPRRQFVLLGLLLALSLGARLAWLGEPCRSPCRSSSDHILIFDETYYVNAARVIAGLQPPMRQPYAGAPSGVDGNSEHPQLAKLVIAGAIELFGDGPFAWRIGSIVFGSLALLGMFALVRAAGGGPWPALGAAALMALDNLELIHSRIGTLDVYVVAAMIWATVLYVRRRPLAAGVLLGAGTCLKLVAPYALVAFLLLELLNRSGPRAIARRFGICAAGWAGAFIGLLAVLDRIAPPYDNTAGKLITGGPFGHLAHMVTFAANQSSPHGPSGIASYPWEWLFDYKPIVYLNVNPAQPSTDLFAIRPAVHFLGMISPPILLLALPALIVAAVGVARRRPDGVAVLGLAWALGTFLPFVLLSLIFDRTSYLYYMVIVMPGVYLAIAALVARIDRRWRWLVAAWMAAVVIAAVIMYPLTPLP
jgi:predicted membrane-bound dolichyl-phosphate-mannose-protein mannosyltransferase